MKAVIRKEQRCKRHRRLRKKVAGTAERPRVCVMISGRHLYAQAVDDDRASTLAAVTTQGDEKGGKNIAMAQQLGNRMAAALKEKGITAVVFDRGGFMYHGRVKAIADAIRAAGIQC